MLKKSVFKWSALFLIVLIGASCQVARQQELIEKQAIKQRKDKRELEKSAFFLKIRCVDDSRVTVEDELLSHPYQYKVYPDGEYDFTLYHVTGKVYDGVIEVIGEGGKFGKYPGYEVCFNESVLSTVDQRGSLNLIIPSPEGWKVIRVKIRSR
ncbi:MAG: hypothetical protein JSU92_12160 [Deltaproteobacteria bacterium]|nr:MAG: hypothetical protein JSU92_12160 [Deltaproteobacteria bacterium]